MSYIVCSKCDNRYQFDYNNRILDALASCFHITTACAATFKYKDILYISYNSQITKQNKPLLDIQLQLIFEAMMTNQVDNALALYLLLNRDFKDFIINQEEHEQNEDFKREIKLFIDTRANLRLDFFQHIDNDQPLHEIYNRTLDSYNNLINSLKKYGQLVHSTTARDIEIKELLLRPLQDVNKVLHKTLNDRIENYVVLDNKENLHAEYNISLYFPKVGLIDSYYIGISKLSCGFCHKYLKLNGYKYRGTHGVCAPNKWKMNLSPQSEDFKTQILRGLSEIEDEDAPLQYRRLSIDSFERKELPELYQLKRDLGLNRYCSSAILDLFDSLGSSINYCCSKFSNMISGQYAEVSDPSSSEQRLIGASEA